jgi:hypothetical protein
MGSGGKEKCAFLRPVPIESLQTKYGSWNHTARCDTQSLGMKACTLLSRRKISTYVETYKILSPRAKAPCAEGFYKENPGIANQEKFFGSQTPIAIRDRNQTGNVNRSMFGYQKKSA